MAGWAAAGQIAGDIFSAWYGNREAQWRQSDQQAFNQREAQLTRDWQTDMASTAYQRTVKDLNAAGLNPMLAYQHGPTPTPTGALAQGGIATPNYPRIDVAGAMQSASAIRVNDATAEKIRAETSEIQARTPTYAVNIEKTRQDIAESITRIQKNIQETSTSAASAANIAQQTENLRATLPQIDATIRQLQSLANLNDAQRAQLKKQGNLTDSQVSEIQQRIKANLPAVEKAYTELKTRHEQLALPQAGMRAAVYDSPLGAWSETLKALFPIGGILGLAK